MARPLWLAAGAICFALAWIGLVLPLMPGFVFLLAALYCFARGNPAWEARMLDHPTYGPPLRHWRNARSISRRSKKSALTAMALAGVLTWWAVGFPYVLISIAVLMAVGTWIWTRPE